LTFETLLYDVADRVATVTLNRPDRHNAFDRRMAVELRQAWEEIRRDPDVACAVLTGAGDKAFCTGVDVRSVREEGGFRRRDAPREEKPPFLRMTALQNGCWKPVITAVNGMVCGGGLHFVADSDLVVCSEHATFFDTHVGIGTISGLEPVALARRIPLEAVLRLALLGGSERMTAMEARTSGLVGEVVARRDLMPRARELARRIGAHAPATLARAKQAIWRGVRSCPI
jgi:E-phenylitaconyl-CoA hydratase